MLRVLWQDRGFLLLIMANLLLMLVYAQFESPLIQYLTRAGTPEVERLIGWLVTGIGILALAACFLYLARLRPAPRPLAARLDYFRRRGYHALHEAT